VHIPGQGRKDIHLTCDVAYAAPTTASFTPLPLDRSQTALVEYFRKLTCVSDTAGITFPRRMGKEARYSQHAVILIYKLPCMRPQQAARSPMVRMQKRLNRRCLGPSATAGQGLLPSTNPMLIHRCVPSGASFKRSRYRKSTSSPFRRAGRPELHQLFFAGSENHGRVAKLQNHRD